MYFCFRTRAPALRWVLYLLSIYWQIDLQQHRPIRNADHGETVWLSLPMHFVYCWVNHKKMGTISLIGFKLLECPSQFVSTIFQYYFVTTSNRRKQIYINNKQKLEESLLYKYIWTNRILHNKTIFVSTA